MLSGDGLIAARLRGAWDDRSLDYDAAVQLDGRALRIAYDTAEPKVIDLTVAMLDGVSYLDGALTLYATEAGAVVLYDSPHLEGLRHRLEAAVCVFPAQTLSLRAFGSERSAPGSDHDRWFDALLDARRIAEESRTVETQRRAFDADRLERHAQWVYAEWATERFADPADRRALVAELEQLGLGFAAALRQLEHAGLRLRQAPEAQQFHIWRRWTDCVQRTFRAADEAWALFVPVLCDSRGAKGALWRRLINRPRNEGSAT